MAPTSSTREGDPHPDLADLCERLEDVRRTGELGNSGLDLRDLGGWRPTTLAVLLASISAACDGGRGVPPIQADGAACLEPSALERLIQQRASHWHEETGSGTIVGSTIFNDQESVHTMLQEVASHVHPRLGLSSTWLASAHALGYELATNVLRHSEAERGVGVVEVDPGRSCLRLAIADNGIGIRTSLARNPKYATTEDLAAIIASMRAAATGEPGKGAGMGLYLAQHVLRDNGGVLLVRSGTAHREVAAGADSHATDLAYLQGTLVAVEARTDRSLDYGRVDKELSAPPGISDRTED